MFFKAIVPLVAALSLLSQPASAEMKLVPVGGVAHFAPVDSGNVHPERYTGKILFLGDSTMAAYAYPTKQRPSYLVAKSLKVGVDNLGEGGTGTENMVATLREVLAKSDATYVVENFALNDRGVIDREQYAKNLKTFVSDVRSAGKIAILEEPNPICRSKEESDSLDEYVVTLRAVAKETGAPLIAQYDKLRAVDGWQKIMMDCLHPAQALYKIKADNEIHALRGIMAKHKGELSSHR